MDSDSFREGGFSDLDSQHYEQNTSLSKILILQSNCHPSQQYEVNIPYDYLSRQLDLGHALYRIFKQIIPLGHSYQVFYYCNQSEYFVFGGMYPFENYLLIGPQFVSQFVISVKIIRIHPPVTLQTETASKKKRVNDRTICEVLKKVAEWRNIHESKNVTLEEASKQVDLPKKTLDDYFYQIKQGQYYGFNFQDNLNERIGVLRKFVKENHTKKSEKPLKILEQFMESSFKEEEQNEQNDSQNSEEE